MARATRGYPARRPEPEPDAPRAQTWQQALASVRAWVSLDAPQRRQHSAALTDWLNTDAADFELLPDEVGVHGFASVRHRNGTEFVAIPGGQMLMGFAAVDIFAVMSVFPSDQVEDSVDDAWAAHFLDARPPRLVAVAPFLVSRDLVRIEDASPLEAIDRDGFRMVSEAEWEWLAREGMARMFVGVPDEHHPLGPTRVPPVEEETGWGLRGMCNEEVPVADTPTRDYVGAPATSAPRIDGDPLDATLMRVCRMGHGAWQSPREAIALHAANRESIRVGRVFRLARPLPVEPSGEPPYYAPGEQCYGALEDRYDLGNPPRARLAILAASRVPGPDTAALVTTGLTGANSAWGREILTLVQPAWDAPGLGPFLDDDAAAAKVIAAIKSKTPEARAWAGYWAARLDRHAEAALAALQKKLVRERKPLAKASMILAVGTLSAHLDASVDTWDKWAADKDAMVCAATAIARHGLGHDVVDALNAASSIPPNADLPWFAGDLAAEAARRLGG